MGLPIFQTQESGLPSNHFFMFWNNNRASYTDDPSSKATSRCRCIKD